MVKTNKTGEAAKPGTRWLPAKPMTTKGRVHIWVTEEMKELINVLQKRRKTVLGYPGQSEIFKLALLALDAQDRAEGL